jgi:hypothetical protein
VQKDAGFVTNPIDLNAVVIPQAVNGSAGTGPAPAATKQ